MKIGVFGREETVKRLQEFLPAETEVVPFIYTKAKETTDLLQTIFNCDVYIFTEYLSYFYVKETIESKRLPVVHMKLDSYRMIASLYRLQREKGREEGRIATDVYNEAIAKEVIKELEINESDFHYYVHPLKEEPDISKVISYYSELWNTNQIDYALASTDEIATQLNKIGIPSRTITIPDLYLEQIAEEAISLVQLSASTNNQLVTGIISIKGLNEDKETTESSLESMNKIKQILSQFTKNTDASFTETSNQEFMIHGSDKLLNHLKSHYRVFPLLQEMKSNLSLPVHLGFGLGLHAQEAKYHAELAIERCARTDGSICYIVNERQEVMGPIGVKKEIDTSSLYQALIHDARLNNELSYHFIDFINGRNNEPFSTNDVALFYQVTKRSAERTVSKLLSGDVIRVTGEERPYRKGRPRKLFTLNH